MRQDNHPQSDPASSYQARIAEEEAKLRWLIARQPGNHELAYYLIFLLTAHNRYAKALEECRRVLKARPGDVIARMWKELVYLRWRQAPRRRASIRQACRNRRWRRITPHTG